MIVKLRQRSPLARWMWERGLSLREMGDLCAVSAESIRQYAKDLDDPTRVVPPEDVLERIVAVTQGALTAKDFYPPHLNGEAAPAAEAAA